MTKKKDPKKSVLIANGRGKYATYSTEETLARGLNRFEGWLCAAGTESIHIGANGNVQLAACKIYGTQGNVFDGTLKLPQDWVVCDKKACMCGGDMQIRKAESIRYKQRSMNPVSFFSKEVESIEDMKWVAPYHFQQQRKQPKTVSWDMGRRCNYACSYCPPEVSNRTDPLRTWEELKSATDQVIKVFANKSKIKWVITGGEPTIIPSYMDWIDYVRGMGHVVHTTTNGSRGPKYLKELIRHSCVGLSLHLEYLDMGRLISSVEAVVNTMEEDRAARDWWFGIRVMVPPGKIESALEVKSKLMAIPGFNKHAQFYMSPIHDYSFHDGHLIFGDLAKYNSEELSSIQSFT